MSRYIEYLLEFIMFGVLVVYMFITPINIVANEFIWPAVHTIQVFFMLHIYSKYKDFKAQGG